MIVVIFIINLNLIETHLKLFYKSSGVFSNFTKKLRRILDTIGASLSIIDFKNIISSSNLSLTLRNCPYLEVI